MKKSLFIITSALLIGGMTFTSCKKDKNNSPSPTPTPPQPTLYQQLGGTTKVNDPANSGTMIEQGRLNIRSVVDSSIFVIAGDTELTPYFQVLLGEVQAGNTTGFSELSKNLTDFFCVGTGAQDYTYTGMSMAAAHNPADNNRIAMKVDNQDFDKFVGDVVTGAAQNGVTDTSIVNQLGAVLNSVRGDVVQR